MRIDSMKRLSVTATFTPVEDLTAVDRHFSLIYSTCLTCNTAGIWHKEALSHNQQQLLVEIWTIPSKKETIWEAW